MNNWQTIIGIFAGILASITFVPYIITTLQKKTRPNRATWCIWAVVGVILCASYYSSGSLNAIWVPASYAVGQVIVAILALRYGEGAWSRFDRLCMLGAGISLILWWQLKSPVIALMINIGIDIFGALPTLKKVYSEPETENCLAWSMTLAASVCNLFAIGQWSFSNSAFPLYSFCINATMVAFILRPTLEKQFSKGRRSQRRKVALKPQQAYFQVWLGTLFSKFYLGLHLLVAEKGTVDRNLKDKALRKALKQRWKNSRSPCLPIQTGCIRPMYMPER
jgi:uncharacterized protein with PQ loop repeat